MSGGRSSGSWRRRAPVSGRRFTSATRPVVVHSGFWGCGAFGGNRELMVGLQVLAAGMAGVRRLVLHTVREDGVGDARAGLVMARDSTALGEVVTMVEMMLSRGYGWGRSNGT